MWALVVQQAAKCTLAKICCGFFVHHPYVAIFVIRYKGCVWSGVFHVSVLYRYFVSIFRRPFTRFRVRSTVSLCGVRSFTHGKASCQRFKLKSTHRRPEKEGGSEEPRQLWTAPSARHRRSQPRPGSSTMARYLHRHPPPQRRRVQQCTS